MSSLEASMSCHYAVSVIGDASHLSVAAVLVTVPLLDLVDAFDDIILGVAAPWSIFAQQVLGSIIGSSHLQTKNVYK